MMRRKEVRKEGGKIYNEKQVGMKRRRIKWRKWEDGKRVYGRIRIKMR
jgi:hypothetical protein